MENSKLLLATAGAFLWFAGQIKAITVSGFNPNADSYVVPIGSFADDYSGVTELTIVRSGFGPEICSGSLLSDGFSLLTAAHCVAGSSGLPATAAYATFNLPGGFKSNVVKFEVNPLYDGTPNSPYDVAVLTLASAAPLEAARYYLYKGDAVGHTMTLAGYGFGGSGASGYDFQYPFGTLRVGQNQYDGSDADGDLLFDFDDGLAAHDVLGSLGLGSSEAFIAPGDDGGPSFIGGQIAGVHGLIARSPNGGTTDIDNLLDSSFGEYAVDVSVSANVQFIDSMLVAPEPKGMFLVGIALIAVSLLGSKRRQQ